MSRDSRTDSEDDQSLNVDTAEASHVDGGRLFDMVKFNGVRKTGFGLVQRSIKLNAYTRMTLALLLLFLVISLFAKLRTTTPPKPVFEFAPNPTIEFQAHLERQIREHCRHLEALSDLEECIRDSHFHRLAVVNSGDDLPPPDFDAEEDRMSLESQYGLVLSYGLQYDASGSQYEQSERYHDSISMKCSIGFGMSVAWSMQFDDRWTSSLDHGVYELANITKPATPLHSFACAELGNESAASMSIYLNCGFDIERDAFGNPRGQDDRDAIETCILESFMWLNGTGADMTRIEPWQSLCKQSSDGQFSCRQDIFAIDKGIPG